MMRLMWWSMTTTLCGILMVNTAEVVLDGR